jgi:hypothetical protein
VVAFRVTVDQLEPEPMQIVTLISASTQPSKNELSLNPDFKMQWRFYCIDGFWANKHNSHESH